MKIKLNDILKKSLNYKFRKGFIKYLSTLEYDEFNEIYKHYTSILLTLIFRYRKDKFIIFSKKWFNYRILQYKYHYIFKLFFTANPKFIERSNIETKKYNNEVSNLIDLINEKSEILQNISKTPMFLTQYSTNKDFIKYYLVIVDNVYNYEILINAMNRLNELKQK